MLQKVAGSVLGRQLPAELGCSRMDILIRESFGCDIEGISLTVCRVIGQVNTMLGIIYGDVYNNSSAKKNVSSIAFAGTVVGQLFFGWTSDHYSRKWALMISTGILILFAALSAGSYGYHGSATGLFAALTAYRFLIGIGIG